MQLTVVVEQDEDDMFVATALELRGCHTQAKTLGELQTRMNEAIDVFIGAEGMAFDTTIICVGCHHRLLDARD